MDDARVDFLRAAKKRELEIAAESGHQVKKARTREPLSDAVENGEGAPKRCMQAMQCAGCLERDVCIAIMSQWLKPEQVRTHVNLTLRTCWCSTALVPLMRLSA